MDTIKSNNLGKGYAQSRWFSFFNSTKYKDEEDRLNRKIELYTRYIVVKEELSIAKQMEGYFRCMYVECSDTEVSRREHKDKKLIIEIASEKVKELSTLETELSKQMIYEYLNGDLQFNTLDISPLVRNRILGQLRLSD
tara:strand:- start:43 stop:459 length:417 start_codon:yes stop_codon:yes gene_type:complete